LPYLIELGRDTVLTCPVYFDGAMAAPTGGSVVITDPYRAPVSPSPVVTIVGNQAECTVPGSLTTALQPGAGWQVVWTLEGLTGMSAPMVHSSAAFLVRRRLYPVISDADIARRLPSLATSFDGRVTGVSTYQGFIEEADTEVQQRLLQAKRRPWMVCEPWVLRDVWLMLTIALVFEDLAAGAPPDAPYSAKATDYRERYEAAWTRASSTFDWDEDGYPDSEQPTQTKPSNVWLR
jgi:hypothetical protein